MSSGKSSRVVLSLACPGLLTRYPGVLSLLNASEPRLRRT